MDEKMKPCPFCGGDGIERCDNPDHGFIAACIGLEIERLGCPGCGHDPDHKMGENSPCPFCNGTGVNH